MRVHAARIALALTTALLASQLRVHTARIAFAIASLASQVYVHSVPTVYISAHAHKPHWNFVISLADH